MHATFQALVDSNVDVYAVACVSDVTQETVIHLGLLAFFFVFVFVSGVAGVR